MRRSLLTSLLILALAGQSCGQGSVPSPAASILAGPLDHYALTGDVQFVHDPAMIRQGQNYYVFSTDTSPVDHIKIRCSSDRINWKICGEVFSAIPAWIIAKLPGIKNLWAPDISFFSGQYHLYYAGSVFGKNTSVIGLATNSTLDPASPDYKWVDRGEVIESTTTDDFNTIDPNILDDGANEIWLTFGSFWTGIKQRRLDPSTGLLSSADTTLYSLARRPASASPPDAIEAPYMVHHGNYYYLFVSFDTCCRGANSTYRIMVGRGNSVNGPFTDMNGVSMMDGGGTELLHGNGQWAGPGGQSIWLDSEKGDLIVYHAYAMNDGSPWLHINSLQWKNDWPMIGP